MVTRNPHILYLSALPSLVCGFCYQGASLCKMVTRAPIINFISQPIRRKKGASASFQQFCMMLLLTSHWSELSHMSISSSKGSWEMFPLGRAPVRKEGENGYQAGKKQCLPLVWVGSRIRKCWRVRRAEKLRNFQGLPVTYFHTAFLSQIYVEFGVRHWGSSILFQDFPILSYHSLMEKTGNK